MDKINEGSGTENSDAVASPVDAIVSLESIFEEICKFREETGMEPKTIHMTKGEMRQLQVGIRNLIVTDRVEDIKKRLRPDLLPPMRKTPEINEGDFIYGLLIMECETGGIHLSG